MKTVLNYITTQGIRFSIIITNDEITFKDEFNKTLVWNNTEYNASLVDAMVKELTTREL